MNDELDWSIAQESESPRDRAKGRWHALLVERFVQGRDREVDYELIDHDESLDADEGLEGSWRERNFFLPVFSGTLWRSAVAFSACWVARAGLEEE